MHHHQCALHKQCSSTRDVRDDGGYDVGYDAGYDIGYDVREDIEEENREDIGEVI